MMKGFFSAEPKRARGRKQFIRVIGLMFPISKRDIYTEGNWWPCLTFSLQNPSSTLTASQFLDPPKHWEGKVEALMSIRNQLTLASSAAAFAVLLFTGCEHHADSLSLFLPINSVWFIHDRCSKYKISQWKLVIRLILLPRVCAFSTFLSIRRVSCSKCCEPCAPNV